MTDTSPDMEREFRRRIMARAPEERLLMAASMHESARTLALASLPPNTSPAATRRFLLIRFYPELARR